MDTVYSITIFDTRDEMDHEGVIPDALWPEAWAAYERMVREAVEAAFPGVDVEIRQEPSTRGVIVRADSDDTREAEWEAEVAASTAFQSWCEWVSKTIPA